MTTPLQSLDTLDATILHALTYALPASQVAQPSADVVRLNLDLLEWLITSGRVGEWDDWEAEGDRHVCYRHALTVGVPTA